MSIIQPPPKGCVGLAEHAKNPLILVYSLVLLTQNAFNLLGEFGIFFLVFLKV